MLRAALLIVAVLVSSCKTTDQPAPAVRPPAPANTPASATPLRQQWLDMFARGYFPGRSGQVFVVPK